MKYGKLVNNALIFCPKQGRDGRGLFHTDLPRYYSQHTDIAAEDGYYPVQYTDKPEGNYLFSWDFVEDTIVQVWAEYTPEPEQEDPIAARLETLEECILEMSEYVYA